MDLFPDPAQDISKQLAQLQSTMKALEARLSMLEAAPSGPQSSTVEVQTEATPASPGFTPVKPPDMNFELQDLMRTVIKNRASDLHLKPYAPPTVRLDGKLVPIGNEELTEEQCRYLVHSALTPKKIERLSGLQEVDHAYKCFGVRFRLNAFLERGHVSAAFRMINSKVPSFAELGLPASLERLASLQDGLVLITGPAGSGKSTTLASVVDWINERRRSHVITIEDPIEFHHRDKTAFISQREVGTDTASFVEALKQALRQDPNVIMVGEMRDAETIMTAVTAAETGHLVLSTLHTPNTVQAIDRIVDSFEGNAQKQVRTLLSSSLRGVVSQKLLNRCDGGGRIPAVEVLINTSTVSSHILDGQTQEIYQYMQRGQSEGMQTFTQSLLSLLERGVISYEDAAHVADRKTELRLASEQGRLRERQPAVNSQRSPKPSSEPTSQGLLDLL